MHKSRDWTLVIFNFSIFFCFTLILGIVDYSTPIFYIIFLYPNVQLYSSDSISDSAFVNEDSV